MVIKSNILYPKEPTMVEVAQINNQGYHFWIELDGYIQVLELKEHEIQFTYKGVQYIYWADMSKFLERFYTTLEVRDKKIDDLLK